MLRHTIVLFSIAGMIACWGSVVTAQGVPKKWKYLSRRSDDEWLS